ncbi:hypothetical protein CU102_20850 [Phyllobacterium brassicacearum]|uniref:Uncharacterized protein n=1 Tax=Phyllobacterium brassicacearum TaxID=314235 RepID=A0A2P7BEH7_9HYPH|nr:hypothetical protein [Phyllobacterium brassicacearum]PSH64891.1 hypothetical protein CU102_20850 [Phyllobacterium brassicacearum]
MTAPASSHSCASIQLVWIASVETQQVEFALDRHAGQSTKVTFTALKENHDREGDTFSQWMQKRVAAKELTSPTVRPSQDAQFLLSVIVVKREKWHEVLILWREHISSLKRRWASNVPDDVMIVRLCG